MLTGALFWDRRRPRLPSLLQRNSSLIKQARTPAVPEERARYYCVATKGFRYT